MATLQSYNSTVAARTRTAAQILETPELLKRYEAKGGLAADLEAIQKAGLRAEVLNQSQSKAQAAGGAATETLLASFVAVQKEYSAVMAIVRAAHHDLSTAGAEAELLAAMAQIVVNESEVKIRDIAKQAKDKDAPADQKPKKTAIRSLSQEALRAEIQKDASALVALKPAHKALARRKVDLARLESLRDAAGALAGHLSDRVVKKGQAKQATADQHQAVADQTRAWGACYGILAAVGREDHAVRGLLSEAARK